MTAATWLLDANLLIAMTHAAHVHHTDAHAWFAQVSKRRFATCAMTQLAFVRLSCNPTVVGESITPSAALRALAELAAHPQHRYWAESPEPLLMDTLASPALVGHRQVSDAYLLGLAQHRQQTLATLDRGLASFATALKLGRHVEFVGARLAAHEPVKRYAVKRKA